MKTRMVQHEKENGLFISLPHLLDGMMEDDRKRMIAYACEDAVLIESVLNAVATYDQATSIESTGAVDCWFGEQTKQKLRLALAPMLDGIVAEEMKNAVEKSLKYERCHRHLESLAHFQMLQRESSDDYDREERRKQWVREYESALTLFPKYAPAGEPK